MRRNPEPFGSSEGSSLDTSLISKSGDQTRPFQLAFEGGAVTPLTKQERMLTLLGRPEGASVAEMMQATSWQQHSVRGFLAGTVKKKLGFSLTSSKAADDVRRYRIKARRGR
jgi:hypothetical protein